MRSLRIFFYSQDLDMTRQERDRAERLANLRLMEVPDEQSAQALNISMERLQEILNSEGYKTILAEVSTEHFQRQQTLNEGWDAVEEAALSNVIDMLKYNKDPDYLLKAATLANRANRRGSASRQNHIIDHTAEAKPIVIQLNQVFVDRLSKAADAARLSPLSAERKQVNLLMPNRVEAMLKTDEDRREQAISVEMEKHGVTLKQGTDGE